MSYNLTYTQDKAESLLKNYFHVSEAPLNYNMDYGDGNTPNDFSVEIRNWKALKDELFDEYDELWKELATR